MGLKEGFLKVILGSALEEEGVACNLSETS